MDTGTIVVLLILAVVVIVRAFLFRDRIKLALKAPGFGLDFEGRNRVQDAARPGEGDPAKSAASAAEGTRHVTASGAGGVAIGGSADKAKVNTRVDREQ